GPDDLGAEKVRLVAAVLRLRRRHPDAFVGAGAGYQPLPTSTGHAVAFARTSGDQPRALTVATRLPVALGRLGGWAQNTVVLPEGRWRDLLTGTEYDGGNRHLSEVLQHGPVAVLEWMAD